MFNDNQKESIRNILLDMEWRCGSADSPTGAAMMYGQLPPSLSKRGDNYLMIEVALSEGAQQKLYYEVTTISTSELSAALSQRKQLEHDIIYLGGLRHELSQKESEMFCQFYASLCALPQSNSKPCDGSANNNSDKRMGRS